MTKFKESSRGKLLIASYRSVQQDTARWLNTDSLEERWMTQWQLNHFLDLCQLLTASTDVIVTDSVKSFFFLL
jgi:hypothetical protein